MSEEKKLLVLAIDPGCTKCEGTGRNIYQQLCFCAKAVEIEAVTKVKRYIPPGMTVPLEDAYEERGLKIRKKAD